MEQQSWVGTRKVDRFKFCLASRYPPESRNYIHDNNRHSNNKQNHPSISTSNGKSWVAKFSAPDISAAADPVGIARHPAPISVHLACSTSSISSAPCHFPPAERPKRPGLRTHWKQLARTQPLKPAARYKANAKNPFFLPSAWPSTGRPTSLPEKNNRKQTRRSLV